MPIACIFSLRPETAGTLSPAINRAAHAAVLELIAADDTELATRIHTNDRVKPLTVALLGALEGRSASLSVNPTRAYDLRVTLLAPTLEALAHRWTAASVPQLTFDGIPWQVERVTTNAGLHPWVGGETFDELLGGAMRSAVRGASERWAFEFVTPVTFRQGGRNQPLPLAELVFGSLLDRWNALAPLPMPPETRQFVTEALAVSRFDLRSAVVPTKGGAIQIGSVGRCAYTATSHDRYGLACVEALARFAFYSGVGAGTTRGFGQTQLLGEQRGVARQQERRALSV